ncbi:hypothetical protein LSTR_LSTR016973, partial [Laodelphax striatellus]
MAPQETTPVPMQAVSLRVENLLQVPAEKPVATVDKKPPMDFDDILPHLGEFGIYQKLLFLMMIPFAFFVAFVYFTQIFITLVPEQH